MSNLHARIEKNRQRIAAAAAGEDVPAEAPRPTGRLQPPKDPDGFQAWLDDLKAKVDYAYYSQH